MFFSFFFSQDKLILYLNFFMVRFETLEDAHDGPDEEKYEGHHEDDGFHDENQIKDAGGPTGMDHWFHICVWYWVVGSNATHTEARMGAAMQGRMRQNCKARQNER